MEEKYIKYKTKYLGLKELFGGHSQETRIIDESIVQELDAKDKILLDSLNRFVIKQCNEDHPLATGIMHESGEILYGLCSKSPLGYDVHGEHACISQAHIFDKNKENYCVLTSMSNSAPYKVKAPCGICRELLRYHYPNLPIIVPHPNIPDKLVKVISKYLLPYPYVSTKLHDEAKWSENIDVQYLVNK